MDRKTRANALVRLLVGGIVLAGLAWLLIGSLETTQVEPYEVSRAHLETWTLVLEPAASANAPLLSVRTDAEFAASLFRQLFRRTMESMHAPSHASIPIVLRGEFDRGLARSMTPDALLDAAREAGLDAALHVPRCLAHRRISEPGSIRQVYFVMVDSPAIEGFRARLARNGQEPFDAAALTPVMFVGASTADFPQWLPIRADERACVSPITIAD